MVDCHGLSAREYLVLPQLFFFLFSFLSIKNGLIPGAGWCWLLGGRLTISGSLCASFDHPHATFTAYICFSVCRFANIIARECI